MFDLLLRALSDERHIVKKKEVVEHHRKMPTVYFQKIVADRLAVKQK